MKRFLPLCALPFLFASCVSSPSRAYNHWTAASVPYEVSWHFLGFQPDEDGSYGNRLKEDGKSIGLTLQRYFLNWNPESPFQPEGGVD